MFLYEFHVIWRSHMLIGPKSELSCQNIGATHPAQKSNA